MEGERRTTACSHSSERATCCQISFRPAVLSLNPTTKSKPSPSPPPCRRPTPMAAIIRASRAQGCVLSRRCRRPPRLFANPGFRPPPRHLQHQHAAITISPSPPAGIGACALASRLPLLQTLPQRAFSSQSTAAADDGAAPTLEETYSRKTPLEHILLRPSMYIGPTERLPPVSSWVLQKDAAGGDPSSPDWKMQREELASVPALLKVFDEILVNASDNRLRHPGSCNRIDVVIERGDASSRPFISVRNNGKSIPVQYINGIFR